MNELEIEWARVDGLGSESVASSRNRISTTPGATIAPTIITDSFATEVDHWRYTVSSSPDGISVLDLGYSSSTECKRTASNGVDGQLAHIP